MAGKARVHELAKELNVSSKDVLAKLSELGEFVKSASSTVEPPVARRLREAFPPAPRPSRDADTPSQDGRRAAGAGAGPAAGACRGRGAEPRCRGAAGPASDARADADVPSGAGQHPVRRSHGPGSRVPVRGSATTRLASAAARPRRRDQVRLGLVPDPAPCRRVPAHLEFSGPAAPVVRVRIRA